MAFAIALGIYFFIGILFSLVFVFTGYKRLLKQAEGTKFRVRLLWMPGAMAVWPILICKHLAGNPD